MPDLDVALLLGSLGFANGRLDTLLSGAASGPDALLGVVSPGGTVANQVLVVASLQTASTEAQALQSALADPPAGAVVVAASGHLASALHALAQAIVGIGPELDVAGGMQTLLRTSMAPGAMRGLAGQLGLAPPAVDELDVNGTTVTLTLVSPGTDFGAAGLLALGDTRLTATFDWNAATSLTLQLVTTVESAVVSDAFVQQLVPGLPKVAAALTVNVDATNGITFGKGVHHRISLPGSLSAFGVELRDFALELPDATQLGGSSTPALALTATIKGSLGPIAAVIDGTGIALDLDAGKVLGDDPAPAAVVARPPDGGGLTVNAGIVRGGGYVQQKHGEYGGVLDLAIGPIEIKAIGLISTDPFSLVLVLSVEFNPGIQLSFGFMLGGVGGLLALERGVSTDALRAGLHNHTIDGLLFPPDPVSAAPHILETLDQAFPPEHGAFVVGPMLEISWGVGVPLVVAKVGVLIALPDPKVIILGLLRVAVPTPDAAIVDLRCTLYGEITPDHILILVSLEGSRVAGFPLGGDFGLLIAYGDDPNFAVTAGGFHPHYRPPAELVGMRRVSIDLSPPAVVTLRADAYFALTANSFQLGTHVQLRADLGVVAAEGHLGFDALVRWAPHFAFEIDLSIGIAVYVFGECLAGVELDLHLEGPAPWRAHGTGSVSFLFFDVSFELGPLQWGDGDNPVPDAVSPVAEVVAALSKATAWHAVAPDQGDRVATIRSSAPAPPDNTVLVHPLGAFEVRQQVVPLETTIDRIGAHPVTETRVNLDAPMIDGATPSHPVAARAVSETTDRFAPAQFLTLTDDEKLSRPAFEEMPSGLRLSGATGDFHGAPAETKYEWNTVYPHHDFAADPTLNRSVLFDPVLLATLLRGGPVGRSPARVASAYAVDPQPIALADPGGVTIRATRDLTTVGGVTADAMTTTAASRVLNDAVQAGAVAAGAAQLVGPGVGS